MTTITFPFSGYPVSRRKTIGGEAEVKLTRYFRIFEETKGTRIWLIPNGKTLPWKFVSVRPVEICEPHDVERFIRGRYWPVIDTMLIARMMRDQGRPDRAVAFDHLANSQLRRLAA